MTLSQNVAKTAPNFLQAGVAVDFQMETAKFSPEMSEGRKERGRFGILIISRLGITTKLAWCHVSNPSPAKSIDFVGHGDA